MNLSTKLFIMLFATIAAFPLNASLDIEDCIFNIFCENFAMPKKEVPVAKVDKGRVDKGRVEKIQPKLKKEEIIVPLSEFSDKKTDLDEKNSNNWKSYATKKNCAYAGGTIIIGGVLIAWLSNK